MRVPGRRHDGRGSRLHPVHVGLDRRSEGRDALAPECDGVHPLGGRHVRRTVDRPALQPRAAAFRPVRFRPVRGGNGRGASRSGSAKDECVPGRGRAVHRGRTDHRVVFRSFDSDHDGPPREPRAGTASHAAHAVVRWRGVPDEVPPQAHGAASERRVPQPVRAHRDQRVHVVLGAGSAA